MPFTRLFVSLNLAFEFRLLKGVDKAIFNIPLTVFNKITIQKLYAHILRLSCLTYGNFSILKIETRLTAYVLEALNDLSEDECEDKCLNHRLCKSINTKNSNGVNYELNSKSTEDPFDDVISTESSGWTYKTKDYKAKNLSDIKFLSFASDRAMIHKCTLFT